MTAIAQALSTALLDFVWQGLLAAFLLWTALFVLRNRSPRARYLASCIALALMAALPVITACLVYTAPALARHTSWSARVPLYPPAALPGTTAAAFDWAGWLARWALPMWSLGVLLCSLRLVWASRQISVLRRESKPAEDAVLALVAALQERMRLARPVRVLISGVADCPSVVGWIKPVVLLPASTVLGLTPQQLEAVLAHEFAHILRYDYLVNMLQAVVETLLFYHPAVWWVSARIRQERELCCDDLAVHSCGDALCYARALTRLERLRVTTPSLALGSAGGSLLHRIQRLTGDSGWQRGPSKLPGILALSFGLACFALNMQWARGQQPDAAASTPAAAENDFPNDVTNDMPNEPGVRIDLGGARLIHRDEVEYPEAAFEKGIQGTVVVEATLDTDGAVGDARVVSGPPELRKAALQSVLQWHLTHDAAGSTRQIGITFQLPPAANAPSGGIGAGVHSGVEGGIGSGVSGGIGSGIAGGVGSGVGTGFHGAYQKQAEMQAALLDAQARRQLLQQEAVGKALENQRLNQLDAQILASEAQLSALRKIYQAQHPDMLKLEAELEALQKEREPLTAQAKTMQDQLQALLTQQGALQEIAPSVAEKQIAELEKRLAELRLLGDVVGVPMFAGRRLKSIQIQGLTDTSRGELLAKLPVHVGDTLAEDSLEKVQAAVKQFDEHLGLSMFTARDGQVEIRIELRP
jgi:TonB family protein